MKVLGVNGSKSHQQRVIFVAGHGVYLMPIASFQDSAVVALTTSNFALRLFSLSLPSTQVVIDYV